jgi:hypothetical protein
MPTWIDQLENLGACKRALEWARDFECETAEAAYLACDRPDWFVWLWIARSTARMRGFARDAEGYWPFGATAPVREGLQLIARIAEWQRSTYVDGDLTNLTWTYEALGAARKALSFCREAHGLDLHAAFAEVVFTLGDLASATWARHQGAAFCALLREAVSFATLFPAEAVPAASAEGGAS